MRKLILEFEEMGWSAEKTTKGHYRLTHPVCGIVIFPGGSASFRGLLNAKALVLRKMREDGANPQRGPK
jgi:hypothetical protein